MAARRAVAGSARARNLGSTFPWDQADLTIKMPRVEMGAAGCDVCRRQTVAERRSAASMLLRWWPHPPGVSAYANFAAYTEWNNSRNLFDHRRLSRSPHRGRRADPPAGPPVAQLPLNELKELQQLLVRAGFNVGNSGHGTAEPHRRQGDAGQIRPAGGIPGRPRLARMRGPRADPAAMALPQARRPPLLMLPLARSCGGETSEARSSRSG